MVFDLDTSMSMEEAGNYILDLVEKFIHVNTFCITSIDESTSNFMNVFNRKEVLAKAGTLISVYEAY